ncbi:ABC transporter ATP-binding protein [Marispirochaeta sp.]|jgi:glycerol transport system ATP-binding protein|uniref:ABC transporter ATP-binding protein n=1 Tax=Marispirochaeta sp. TaxID=2038653 RepID=UPI0029C6D08D|nr:ABC transporter ATP-binding protein [Marispirochaeta sp.]
MATIELRDVWHSYDLEGGKSKDWQYAVEDINITYENGYAVALLGPSGCGKTTLLKIISGLTRPTKGRVLFDGKDVSHLSAKERHIAQVFQFPVVYDSMNVYGNIAFPLANDGIDSSTIRKRVYEVAEILEITELLKEPAGRLNSADKQKVSLGRGIVRPNTAAVLLDEPLTVIDPKAQWGLRRKLKEVQKELNFTMIYVTHDQHEALTFAEKVTVMQVGKIDQTGTPEELHEYPASMFIGYFIGSPGMNMMDCTVAPDGTVFYNGTSFHVPKRLAAELLEYGTEFTLGIRPENVELSMKQEKNTMSGTVKLVEDTGAYKIVTVNMGSLDLKTRASETMKVEDGQTVWMKFPEKDLKFFKDGKKVL